jgi:hypothetical protein
MRSRIHPLVLAAIAFSACDTQQDAPATLEEARARWLDAQIEDYTVQQSRQFSVAAGRDTPKPWAFVTVREGEVVGVADPDLALWTPSRKPGESAPELALTVEEAFALIERARRDSTRQARQHALGNQLPPRLRLPHARLHRRQAPAAQR